MNTNLDDPQEETQEDKNRNQPSWPVFVQRYSNDPSRVFFYSVIFVVIQELSNKPSGMFLAILISE